MGVGSSPGGADVGGPGVRVALDADVDDLVRLDELARAHLGELRGGAMYLLHSARPTPVDVSLRDDLADPRRRVLVGLIGSAPVGYAVASLVELRDGSVVADVSELFVEPPGRSVGVGEALMEELVAWARHHGCVGIDARAMPGDRATKNFFESFGLVARAITVHRDLRHAPQP